MPDTKENSVQPALKSQKTRIAFIRVLSIIIIFAVLFLIIVFFKVGYLSFWGNPSLSELGNTTFEEKSSSNTALGRAVTFQCRYAPWSMSAIQLKTYMDSRNGFWENFAVKTLRAAGSAQENYRSEHPDQGYAAFQELKDTLGLRQDYTLDYMVENYMISWETNNVSTALTEIVVNNSPTYTIIACPRDTRPGYLSTFAITEDRIIRIFNPDNDNDPDITGSWDPVL